jgi:hypothetical protein
MPVQPTYPGVYIEELPSGVRTITGVSTSVAAFVGAAKRGPINKAVHILSYADYERRFGGLDAGSEMSYAVRQFFLNGGTDAWVVRLAKGAQAAFRDLLTDTGNPSLRITALEEGFAGNFIQLRVDRATPIPASTFNLTFLFISPDNPNDARTERFENLSMNKNDPRYVVDIVAGESQLVKVERTADVTLTNIKGKSTSGEIDDVKDVLSPTKNRFLVSVNGLEPVPVQIDLTPDVMSNGTPATRLQKLCDQIQAKVQAQHGGEPAREFFTCAPDGKRIVMTSGKDGEASTVRVLPAPNDASVALKLGSLNGGTDVDAVAQVRPRELPEHGKLLSDVIALGDLDNPPGTPVVPGTGGAKLQIVLDGSSPAPIDITAGGPATGNLQARLADIAGRLQAKVQEAKNNDAFKKFTCTVEGGNKLLLASGSRGEGSSVQVFKDDDLAVKLKLLAPGATATPGKTETLQGGTESPLQSGDIYNAFIASRVDRKGIFALEGVDLFNLLCLPGITDAGVLADADSYCKERRAFFVIDAPAASKSPAQMVTTISGTALPKSDYAAVYYPWIQIADPLKSGKLRVTAPCGTIAGLYARTDASRGVWKAPAGTEATLTGVQAVEYNLTDRENGTLNPLGVNCIRVLPVYGPVSWGARTLRGADALTSEWKYIPVRRLALYIEESLFRGTQWVVFEPNDEPLWSQIRLNVGAFMNTLFRQGAFQGKTPREAYLVKCDRETTTQDDINRGVVNILVGFAPLKPAEFVFIKIQQLAGQIQA